MGGVILHIGFGNFAHKKRKTRLNLQTKTGRKISSLAPNVLVGIFVAKTYALFDILHTPLRRGESRVATEVATEKRGGGKVESFGYLTRTQLGARQ